MMFLSRGAARVALADAPRGSGYMRGRVGRPTALHQRPGVEGYGWTKRAFSFRWPPDPIEPPRGYSKVSRLGSSSASGQAFEVDVSDEQANDGMKQTKPAFFLGLRGLRSLSLCSTDSSGLRPANDTARPVNDGIPLNGAPGVLPAPSVPEPSAGQRLMSPGGWLDGHGNGVANPPPIGRSGVASSAGSSRVRTTPLRVPSWLPSLCVMAATVGEQLATGVTATATEWLSAGDRSIQSA